MCGAVSLGAARSRLFAGHREQKPPQISSSLAWAASPKEAALGWRLPSLQLRGCREKTELGWRKRPVLWMPCPESETAPCHCPELPSTPIFCYISCCEIGFPLPVRDLGTRSSPQALKEEKRCNHPQNAGAERRAPVPPQFPWGAVLMLNAAVGDVIYFIAMLQSALWHSRFSCKRCLT